MTIERNRNVVFDRRVDAPYWEGLAQGILKIQRCVNCAEWIWPAEHRCGGCGSFELRWQALDPVEGRVYSWTRTHYPFVPAYTDLIPYINVLVELPDAGGRRMVGLLTDRVERVRIGDRVSPVFEASQPRTRDLPALRWRLSRVEP